MGMETLFDDLWFNSCAIVGHTAHIDNIIIISCTIVIIAVCLPTRRKVSLYVVRKRHERKNLFLPEMRTIAAGSVLPMKTMTVIGSGEYTDGRKWTTDMIHELERQERRIISRESVTLLYSALHGSRMTNAHVDNSSRRKIPQPSH
jgi:hypothetical protein